MAGWGVPPGRFVVPPGDPDFKIGRSILFPGRAIRYSVIMLSLAADSRLPLPLPAHGQCADSTPNAPARAADDQDSDRGTDGDDQLGIATKTRDKPKKPSQFKVLMLNDDYTPMEFVVMVLKRFFHMDLEQATRVMLHVHQKGVGVCGIFPYEIAETKVNQVMDFARQNQHPLQCTLEKA